MNFNILKYRQNISAFTLIFYFVISAFSAFHSHQTDFNNEINYSQFEKVQKDLFNDDNVCKLYSFSSSQYSNHNYNEFSYALNFENLNLLLSENTYFSTYYNNNCKRGPPQLI